MPQRPGRARCRTSAGSCTLCRRYALPLPLPLPLMLPLMLPLPLVLPRACAQLAVLCALCSIRGKAGG